MRPRRHGLAWEKEDPWVRRPPSLSQELGCRALPPWPHRLAGPAAPLGDAGTFTVQNEIIDNIWDF